MINCAFEGPKANSMAVKWNVSMGLVLPLRKTYSALPSFRPFQFAKALSPLQYSGKSFLGTTPLVTNVT